MTANLDTLNNRDHDRDEYETPAPDRLARITAHLDSGRRVLIANPGRPVIVTPRTAERFADAGQPLFRVRGTHLEMRRGRRYESLRFSPIVFLED